MKFIDLFCGIGGFHLALQKFNIECVFACDKDKECQYIYEKNFNIKVHSDIKKINEKDVPDHDILTAGFPCQSMSKAGKRLGFDDPRGKLFEEIIRIAKYKKPKLMILENVKNIKTINNSTIYKYIYKSLTDINYNVIDYELNPYDFGIPQNRPRIYFICVLNNIKIDFNKIKFNKTSDIINIFEKNINKRYYISNEIKNIIDSWNIILKNFINEKISYPINIDYFNIEKITNFPSWKQNHIIKNKLLYLKYKLLWDSWLENNKIFLNKNIYKKIELQIGKYIDKNFNLWNYYLQLRPSGIRIKKTNYFPTLVAINQIPIYGREKRYLTCRECANLQSFPKSHILHENNKICYKQLGNSVNVLIITEIMSKLINYL